MKHNPVRQVLFPILAAFIWGTAFVAQDKCADVIDPFTFNAIRCYVAVVALLVIIVIFDKVQKNKPVLSPAEKKAANRQLWIGGLCCGTALAIAGKLTGAEWTRTPLPSGTTAVLRRNEAGSCEIDICTTQLPIRPAFTLPSTFAVDSTPVQTAAEAVPQAAQEPASAEVYSFFITGTAPAMECALTVTVPENAGTVFTVSYPYQAGSTAQDACTVSGVKTGDVLCVDGIHRTLTVNGTSWLAYTDYFTRWPTVAPGENRILQKASAITLEYYPVYL